MACGSCSARRAQNNEYVWAKEGAETITYAKEILAAAKVKRDGGAYVTRPKT